MEENKKNKFSERNIGYLLLTPPLLSVIFFLINVLCKTSDLDDLWIGEVITMEKLSYVWSGYGENHMSALPIYLSVMALAGAYLIKGTDKK